MSHAKNITPLHIAKYKAGLKNLRLRALVRTIIGGQGFEPIISNLNIKLKNF